MPISASRWRWRRKGALKRGPCGIHDHVSATLDTSPGGERAIDAAGGSKCRRQFEVRAPLSWAVGRRIEDRMAFGCDRGALREEKGSVLLFLPGARKSPRVSERLEDLPTDLCRRAAFGALSPAEAGTAAVSPPGWGIRKIVLATDIGRKRR